MTATTRKRDRILSKGCNVVGLRRVRLDRLLSDVQGHQALFGDHPVCKHIVGATLLSLVLIPCHLAAAEMDEVCVQRLIGAQNKRLQHCSEKFQGEHRELCETAAHQEHAKAMQICRSRDEGAVPDRR